MRGTASPVTSWARTHGLPDVYLGLAEVERCWALPRKAPSLLGSAWPAIVRALRRSAPGPVLRLRASPPGRCAAFAACCALSGIDPRRCLFIDEAPGRSSPWVDALLRFARRMPAGLSAAVIPSRSCAQWCRGCAFGCRARASATAGCARRGFGASRSSSCSPATTAPWAGGGCETGAAATTRSGRSRAGCSCSTAPCPHAGGDARVARRRARDAAARIHPGGCGAAWRHGRPSVGCARSSRYARPRTA